MGMTYEITEKLSDDIVVNNAVTENMKEISYLRNMLEVQQKQIDNLNTRLNEYMIKARYLNDQLCIETFASRV